MVWSTAIGFHEIPWLSLVWWIRGSCGAFFRKVQPNSMNFLKFPLIAMFWNMIFYMPLVQQKWVGLGSGQWAAKMRTGTGPLQTSNAGVLTRWMEEERQHLLHCNFCISQCLSDQSKSTDNCTETLFTFLNKSWQIIPPKPHWQASSVGWVMLRSARCFLAFFTDCAFLSNEPKMNMVECGQANEEPQKWV